MPLPSVGGFQGDLAKRQRGGFRFIDESGYDGWIGCEYIPAGNTEEGLAWAKPYL